MEIVNIYWREDALANFKDIVASYYRLGKKSVERMIGEVAKDIERVKSRPYHGYIESSMLGQPQRICSYYTTRDIKILYYTENDTLYVIDFWEA